MAKPRIFISSTFYDLRVIRADIERFIKEAGYEPVLFERGHIPYGKDEALEEYCYREINTCDIIVTIIGGNYGTQSKNAKHSITQKELRTAIELGKQIYVFAERSVYAEYRTFLKNRDVEGFQPTSVNNPKVFEFIEEIYALPAGNPVEPFEISDDIVRYLREQWAGLFQRMLQDSSRAKEFEMVESMKSTASTLNHLVTYLTKQKEEGNDAIKEILMSSHPAFGDIKKAAAIPYRVVFHTFDELNEVLKARSYVLDDAMPNEECYEWDNSKLKKGIRVKREIFDENNRLKIYTPEDWKDEYITTYKHRESKEVLDDEMPF